MVYLRQELGVGRITVTIYTRPGCHLCENAKQVIKSAGGFDFVLEEVNIDEHPDLRDRYQYDIPVVLINGVKAFKHRVDAGQFQRKLRRFAGTG
jgi:glutaredoxin